MVETKGLDPAIADKIGTFVRRKGTFELLDELEQSDLGQNNTAKVGNKVKLVI